MTAVKVAILTQPLGHNYGGLLQAYALQHYLKSLGCEVQTIDRRVSAQPGPTIIDQLCNLMRLALGRIKSMPTKARDAEMWRKLAAFRDTHLSISPELMSEEALRQYFQNVDFDAVVVGSDQVWRPRYSPSLLNFYLNFLNDINSPAKRLAYAASFGVDDWEYPDELSDACGALARRFDAVSVREKSAVALCRDRFGVSAQWVVDPTFLLDIGDYDRLIAAADAGRGDDYILTYVLDFAEDKARAATMVGETLQMPVWSIKPHLPISQVPRRQHNSCRLVSVESWLRAFRNARFVVTDSFHGAVFSIIFNVPFIAVGNTARGMARFESLLEQFGLKERLVVDTSALTSALIATEIDWPKVNQRRQALAAEGRAFLARHLSDIS